MFEILVIYTANSKDARDSFVSEMISSGVLDAIRNENGCLKYEYNYSYDNECSILLYEAWENAYCQKAHMTTDHMKTASEIKQKYISSVFLKRLSEF